MQIQCTPIGRIIQVVLHDEATNQLEETHEAEGARQPAHKAQGVRQPTHEAQGARQPAHEAQGARQPAHFSLLILVVLSYGFQFPYSFCKVIDDKVKG